MTTQPFLAENSIYILATFWCKHAFKQNLEQNTIVHKCEFLVQIQGQTDMKGTV